MSDIYEDRVRAALATADSVWGENTGDGDAAPAASATHAEWRLPMPNDDDLARAVTQAAAHTAPTEIRVRWNKITDRIEAYHANGKDSWIMSVGFPLGYEPTVAEITEAMNREHPRAARG